MFASLLPFAQVPSHWLDRLLIDPLTRCFADGSFLSYSFNVRALLALLLVSFSCGAVGALIVGGRMAFFSDALSHCAFAGISLGFLLFGLVLHRPADEFWQWATPVMLAFGTLVGLGIAAVRGRTALSSDTVIGVFFAASVGLAAALRKLIRSRALFNMEDFLFGDPVLVSAEDVVHLALLAALTAAVMAVLFNRLLLASFSQSLALSRRIPVRADGYVLVVLLALIVNLCVRSVGVLLINALLIVPAASAVNLASNLRQVFWLSVGLCVAAALGGQVLSWETAARTGVEIGTPGAIVLLAASAFVGSLVVGPHLRRWAGLRNGRTRPDLPYPAGEADRPAAD